MSIQSLLKTFDRKCFRPLIRSVRGRWTLQQSLERLERESRRVKPEGPILDWGRRFYHFETPAEERTWFARAWWGNQAFAKVHRAVSEGRVEEAMALIEPTDTRHLDNALAEGRGAVLACAHLGPYSVGHHLIARLSRDVLVLQSHLLPPVHGVKALTLSLEAERRTSMAACLLQLRKNGLVLIAADGRWGQRFQLYPFLKGSFDLNPGTAQLSRMALAPTLWFFLLWDLPRKRIRVLIEESGLDPAGAGEDWDEVWGGAYLRRLGEIMTGAPENLTFAGGIWNPARNGALPVA